MSRTTVDIDDELLREAKQATGETLSLIHI